MELGSRYVGPLANISRACVEELLIMWKSPVITWSAGLYMNWELDCVQSEGIILKIINVMIPQHGVEVKYVGCNRCGICMWNYSYISLKYGIVLDLTDLWWRILTRLNSFHCHKEKRFLKSNRNSFYWSRDFFYIYHCMSWFFHTQNFI
jgi:hypothetical protein